MLKGYRTDPSDDVLEYLSGQLAGDWFQVGNLLRIDNEKLRAIDREYQDSGQKALVMLKTWRNRLPLYEDGTSILASVLKVSGLLNVSEKVKEMRGTESAVNALTAQVKQMDTSISSGSTPSLQQPGQIHGTNQDEPSMYPDF